MNTLLYIIIFIMGTVFGSFYTLAVHRIPKRQDITHTHSYCPNCNHKLGFLDLIPVFSYIFLGAKCRYCKEKIRPRYFIIELLSGISFVIISYLMNVKVESLNWILIAESAFMVLYLCYIFLMAGIDKEYRRIEKSITIYGIIISIMYIVYLCVIEHASIYRYVIYLIFYILILILDTITLKQYAKNSYINGIILTILTMCIFTGEYITISTIILVSLAIAFTILLTKIKDLVNKNRKKDEHIAQKISIGFYLGVSNIINLIFVLAYYKFLV